MKTCRDVNIALCYPCKKGLTEACSITAYKKLFHFYDQKDMKYIVKKHINDLIYIRAAMELYYPDFLNEIEKYCALV